MNEYKTVTVIGATGTMGANAAGIFASFGEAKVFCMARDIERVKSAIPRIISSVKANSIEHNLVPVDYSMFEQCISQSDLIFESVSENLEIKKDIHSRINEFINPSAISCTGSSGLSITDIAECYSDKSRFFGVHMFNPPYSLPLCELIGTDYSDESIKKEFEEYLSEKLRRVVIRVKDYPAFLANRIGFQFMNEALLLAERYQDKGGIDYIDAVLGQFTGRTLPPLATVDFVGLDVHKAIVDNIYCNTNDFAHDTFIVPDYVKLLVQEGKLGKKTGAGLYKTIVDDRDSRQTMVYDIRSRQYRPKAKYEFQFIKKVRSYLKCGNYQMAFDEMFNDDSFEASLCIRFLLKYILYSEYVTKEVGYSSDAADDAMAMGFNWCPPRAMYAALSKVIDVVDRMKYEFGETIDVEGLVSGIVSSKYDYRSYFKSGE